MVIRILPNVSLNSSTGQYPPHISASGTIFPGIAPLNLHFFQLSATARGLLVFQSPLRASKTVKHYTLHLKPHRSLSGTVTRSC